MVTKIPIVRTVKTKTPALWERGGAFSKTGSAVVLALPDGSKPKAVYTVQRGHRACREHALIPIRAGMYVIEVAWRAQEPVDETVSVMRIVSIPHDADFAEVEPVGFILPSLETAVSAAREKAKTHHCRSAVWVKEDHRSSFKRKYK